jgi:hypothetical protein
MNVKTTLFVTVLLLSGTALFAQSGRLKGNGQIFWEEHFNWGNPSDPKGWTAPAGWLIEDLSTDNNGIVWTWTRDSMQGPMSKRDGGYILNSSSRDNGFLAIDLDYHNAYKNYMEMLYVNSSITLPIMDFTNHPSVIVSFEQMFKYFNSPRMVMEVSNDNGRHWAEFDLKMGTPRGVNTLNLPNSGVGHFTANISEVAAGMSQVIIKITWSGSILYFWMLDDLTFAEGWNNDLKMNHYQVSLVDGSNTNSQGFMHMMPKTQILPIGNFQGSVINYGDEEQTNIRFAAEIRKNGIVQFDASSTPISSRYYGDPADTLLINQSYTPVDFGHYQLTLEMKSDQTDQNPDNSRKSWLFHVTDSVFARTPEVSEADESPWRDFYQYTHEGDIMAVEFNPIADCEASSISVYVSKANVGADFKVVLMEITANGEQHEAVELVSSEMMSVDSTLLKNGWVTLPLELDGVGEKMKAGKRYLAGVQFWTYISETDLINRKNAFWIGSTKSYPGSAEKQWTFMGYEGTWRNGSAFNKMIRLNINNHENRIDGIVTDPVAATLNQNFPNPFVDRTQISYQLAEGSDVTLEIRDLTGRLVLVRNLGFQPAGQYAQTVTTVGLGSGTYFYSLRTNKQLITKQMTIQ